MSPSYDTAARAARASPAQATGSTAKPRCARCSVIISRSAGWSSTSKTRIVACPARYAALYQSLDDADREPKASGPTLSGGGQVIVRGVAPTPDRNGTCTSSARPTSSPDGYQCDDADALPGPRGPGGCAVGGTASCGHSRPARRHRSKVGLARAQRLDEPPRRRGVLAAELEPRLLFVRVQHDLERLGEVPALARV